MCRIANKAEMNEVLKTIEDLDEQIKALKEQRDAAVERVKKFMGTRDNVLTENFDVKYTTFTQKRFDTTTFKKECPVMYDSYIKEVESTRFTYKRRLDEDVDK